MDNLNLRAFISKILKTRRLRFGDLRRLQRDVLPKGAANREEVEALLDLDRALERADAGWPVYLSDVVKEFVIASADRPGAVESEAAEWLLRALSGTSAKTVRSIMRDILASVAETDEVVGTHRAKSVRRKRKGVATPPVGATTIASSLVASQRPGYEWHPDFRWGDVRLSPDPQRWRQGTPPGSDLRAGLGHTSGLGPFQGRGDPEPETLTIS
jgi:hypothetical protein